MAKSSSHTCKETPGSIPTDFCKRRSNHKNGSFHKLQVTKELINDHSPYLPYSWQVKVLETPLVNGPWSLLSLWCNSNSKNWNQKSWIPVSISTNKRMNPKEAWQETKIKVCVPDRSQGQFPWTMSAVLKIVFWVLKVPASSWKRLWI